MDTVMSEDLQVFLLYVQWKDTIKHVSWAICLKNQNHREKKKTQNRQKIEARISVFIIAVQNQNKQKSNNRHIKILATKTKNIHPSRHILLSFMYLPLESVRQLNKTFEEY